MDQDIKSVDNSSEVSESQSIGINLINFNNHNNSDDCESHSIEINHISLSNTILNIQVGPDNIVTRVKARNEKARKKKIHKKSQHF